MTLYRGTSIPSPVIEYSPKEETPEAGHRRLLRRFSRGTPTRSVNYLSTSKNVNIAKGFTGLPLDFDPDVEYDREAQFDLNNTPGYVHVLYLSPGCRVFDFKDHYKDALRREEEVLLLPGIEFIPKTIQSKFMFWDVRPSSDAA